MTQQRTYPAGVTSWIDIEVDDVDAAQSFYGGLLGWTFHTATPPGVPAYVIAQLDGQDVAGLGAAAATEHDPGTAWNTYVAVDDIDAAVAAVEARGGQVTIPPQPAGEGGVMAGVTDPAGVAFRLWQARQRLGAQLTNAPGTWNFSDLWTTDPAAAKEFYGAVFGWEYAELGFATMIRRPGYGDHLAATVDPGIHERQAGVNVPPGFADAIGWLGPPPETERPQWHVTFTVADRDQTATRVEQLGGEVVREDDTEWTKSAVIVDPEGARFTASQFAPAGG